MQLLTIDFETYYDKQYSLSKMTMEEYIRSPLFEVIGVSVAIEEDPAKWFSGTMAEVGAWLAQFNWADSMVLGHNTLFDGAILSWVFNIRPKGLADTLSMARALHGSEVGGSLAKLSKYYELGEKGTEVINALGKRRADFSPEELTRYSEYCKNDVNLTYKLFNALIADGFPLGELRLVDLTLRMFTEPKLVLNTLTLIEHLRDTQDKKEQLLKKVTAEKSTLMSNPQFAQYLTLLGVTPPTKISPTTGKETWAFSKNDEGFKALLEHPNEEVQMLAAARVGVKSTLEETRTQRFIDIASRGLMPVPLRYYAAHTGRWGGTDSINIQNFPRKSKIKSAIVSPPDYYFVDADSSQIEARTIAWLAGQADLVEAFAKGEDVYRIMASAIYGKEVSLISGSERFVGKTTILGAGYGMGAAKFQKQLKVFGVETPLEECERIIAVYRQTYPHIPLLWKQGQEALEAMIQDRTAPLGKDGVLVVEGKRGIKLPNGMYLRYPNLRKEAKAERGVEFVYDTMQGKRVIKTKIYGGKLIENCIAEGSLVLTERGWVAIEHVRRTDKVHDGVEFVSHGGVVFKSVQGCVSIDGVYMTPDHEVLTNEGWKTASQKPEPYRPDIRNVESNKRRTQQRKKTVLAFSMPVWGFLRKSRRGCNEGSKTRRNPQLRMRYAQAYREKAYDSRNEQTSGIRGMAQYVRSLPATFASSMGKLRRAWDNCMQALAEVLYEFLDGHGFDISAGFGFKSQRQQRAVFATELRMDYPPQQHNESAQYGNAGGCNGFKQKNGHTAYDPLLPLGARVAGAPINAEAGPKKPVYDILNSGPRNRFVVKGDKAPFIVHNCCQALARIIIGEQLIRIASRYPVVMTVHDAVACLIKKTEIGAGLYFVDRCMKMVPKWATGLPLSCELGYGLSYADAGNKKAFEHYDLSTL